MKRVLVCCSIIAVVIGVLTPVTGIAEQTGTIAPDAPGLTSPPVVIQGTTAAYISASFPPTALLMTLVVYKYRLISPYNDTTWLYAGKIQDTVVKTLYHVYFYPEEQTCSAGAIIRLDIQKTDTNLWYYKFSFGEGDNSLLFIDILRKAYP